MRMRISTEAIDAGSADPPPTFQMGQRSDRPKADLRATRQWSPYPRCVRSSIALPAVTGLSHRQGCVDIFALNAVFYATGIV